MSQNNFKITTRKMTVDEWIDVQDNPRQRNTMKHAITAKRKHLKSSSAEQSIVYAASVNGELFKLDGHTRALLWSDHTLPRPHGNHVFVHVFHCDNIDDVKSLYTHFDSRDALESVPDQIDGACREHGIVLKSSLLSKSKWSVAIRMADSAGRSKPAQDDLYHVIGRWKDEIAEVDSWDLVYIPGAVLTLAFMLARKYGNRPKEFFQKVSECRGVHNEDKTFDGVYALTSHINERRAAKTMTGYDNLHEIVKYGFSAYKCWVDQRMIKKLRLSDLSELTMDRQHV